METDVSSSVTSLVELSLTKLSITAGRIKRGPFRQVCRVLTLSSLERAEVERLIRDTGTGEEGGTQGEHLP